MRFTHQKLVFLLKNMVQMLNEHLQNLEDEAVYIIREVAAQFERPALLFSGGKDSITLVRLAQKAFSPGKFPFFLLHIDTGHNFQETLDFRDQLVKSLDEKLVVAYVQESIDKGRVQEETGKYASRNALQTVTLLDAIESLKIDACIGGARRDEEKARAKERIFSFRDEFGGWNAKKQRPELWNLLNGRININQHIRAFPISNWTEEDVWQYIKAENLAIPSIYFAHQRKVFLRDGVLMPFADFVQLDQGQEVFTQKVRFRTVGDISCTAAIASNAETVDEIIAENAAAKTSERGARMDDKRSENAMEARKQAGYF